MHSTHFSRAHRTLLVTLSGLGFGALPYFASAELLHIESHRIQWTGSMPAQAHHGLLTPQNIELSINENGTIEKLHAVMDMGLIDVTDLKDGKMRDKLIAHLKSDDFFAVTSHPTAEFVMESHEGQMLSGKLIIRGIEKPLQIPVDLKRSNNGGWSLSGAFEFNRHDFDVKYQNKGLFSTAKDKLIRDEIQVEVNLSAVSAE
jgi:hypothetical protein